MHQVALVELIVVRCNHLNAEPLNQLSKEHMVLKSMGKFNEKNDRATLTDFGKWSLWSWRRQTKYNRQV